MSPLDSPWPTPSDLGTPSAAALLGLAADVTLLLDAGGVILDLRCNDGGRLRDLARDWPGRDWLSTVSADSRPRLTALLREAENPGATGWVHVKHPSPEGAEIPVQYRAIGLGASGRVLAVARDLQTVASLQQQLVDAQQALERDYWRYREMETRYRLLFRMIPEGTLLLEAATLRVAEANPAAHQLLGQPPKGIVGRSFTEGFDEESTGEIRALLARLEAGAAPESVRARRSADGAELLISASLVRQGQDSLFLIRLAAAASATDPALAKASGPSFDQAVESAPDCILIADPDGRVVAANPAFFELAQLPLTHRVRGEPLDQWLGRSGVDVRVLLSNLKKYGTLRLFRTTFQGQLGASTEVEVSAASIGDGNRPYLGFVIRDIGRRLTRGSFSGEGLPAWITTLTERVGQAPLKDLVRESTEQIERLCIDAALRLTEDNRASAAELLGLSRQSLYVKLARYGLGASAADEADEAG